jgi:general secretion pathway protein K
MKAERKIKTKVARKIICSQEGIALLTVLWVLVVLMVIVFSFSFAIRTETQATVSFKEGIEKKFLAEAGLERAFLEILYRRQNLNQEVLETWKADGTVYEDQLGEGAYRVKIGDESGKVDINTAPEVLLRNLVANLGLEEGLTDTIVDSILDWKDADDFYRLHGAESDYYQSLPNPYKAKNAPFDTLEELLLVKGVTPGILYGDGQTKGLIQFLTVHGKGNKINVNAAPKEVLMALPGMSAEMADAIITYRQVVEIKNLQDIAGILGANQALMQPFISLGSSNTFTVESLGYKKDPQSGYGIRATVLLTGENRFKYLYYKNPAAWSKNDVKPE